MFWAQAFADETDEQSLGSQAINRLDGQDEMPQNSPNVINLSAAAEGADG